MVNSEFRKNLGLNVHILDNSGEKHLYMHLYRRLYRNNTFGKGCNL